MPIEFVQEVSFAGRVWRPGARMSALEQARTERNLLRRWESRGLVRTVEGAYGDEADTSRHIGVEEYRKRVAAEAAAKEETEAEAAANVGRTRRAVREAAKREDGDFDATLDCGHAVVAKPYRGAAPKTAACGECPAAPG